MVQATRLPLTRLLTFATFVGLFIVGAVVGVAHAGQTESQVGSIGSYGGYNFYNAARTFSDEFAGTGSARTRTRTGGSDVPSGWLGSEPRLFNDDGALCATGGMSYSAGRTNESVATTGWRGSCGIGYFYSYGKSARWDGDGYAFYFTYRSPKLFIG